MPPKQRSQKHFVGANHVGIRNGDYVKNVAFHRGWPHEVIHAGPFPFEVKNGHEDHYALDRYVIKTPSGNRLTYGTGEAALHLPRLADGRYQNWVDAELAVPAARVKKVASAFKTKGLIRRLRGDMPASERLSLVANHPELPQSVIVNSVAQAIEASRPPLQ